MPLFKLEVRKATQAFGGRKWCNTYFTEQSDATSALLVAQGIWEDGERNFHGTGVYCYEVYANQVGDPPFTVGATLPTPSSIQLGLVDDLLRGELLPDFCAVRVDFPVLGSRPSRKFYKPLLREVDSNGNALVGPALLAGFLTGLDNLTAGPLVDVDGELWNGTWSQRGITSKRFGREAALSVPPPPVV